MTESEHDYPPEQRDLRNQARQAALDAGAKLWDSYAVADDDFSGVVVTGYVLIAEGVLPSGYTSVAWSWGNGQPPGTDGLTGLAIHRVDGLLRHVVREIYGDRGASE